MASANQEIKELKQELKELASMVKDNAKKSIASNVIGFDRTEIRRMAKKAGRSVRGYINEKQKQATDLRDDAQDKISANPFKAIAAAAATGLILGALLKNRD